MYPLSQQGFALLNYTGSEIFNEWMRIRASNHGFNLTDATLEYEESTSPTSWQDFNQNIRKDLEDLVKNQQNFEKTITERDIFKAFGMPFIYPEDRNQPPAGFEQSDRMWNGMPGMPGMQGMPGMGRSRS